MNDDRPLDVQAVTIPLPVETPAGDSIGANNKRVDDATLTLEEQTTGAIRRVLTVETRDGWTYRFQRYDDSEPWVRYNRDRPNGERVTQSSGAIPEAAQTFAAKVDDGTISPSINDYAEATRDERSAPDPYQEAIAADGGQQDGDTPTCGRCGEPTQRKYLQTGLCPSCAEQRRIEERRIERRTQGPLGEFDDPAEYGDY